MFCLDYNNLWISIYEFTYSHLDKRRQYHDLHLFPPQYRSYLNIQTSRQSTHHARAVKIALSPTPNLHLPTTHKDMAAGYSGLTCWRFNIFLGNGDFSVEMEMLIGAKLPMTLLTKSITCIREIEIKPRASN